MALSEDDCRGEPAGTFLTGIESCRDPEPAGFAPPLDEAAFASFSSGKLSQRAELLPSPSSQVLSANFPPRQRVGAAPRHARVAWHAGRPYSSALEVFHFGGALNKGDEEEHVEAEDSLGGKSRGKGRMPQGVQSERRGKRSRERWGTATAGPTPGRGTAASRRGRPAAPLLPPPAPRWPRPPLGTQPVSHQHPARPIRHFAGSF